MKESQKILGKKAVIEFLDEYSKNKDFYQIEKILVKENFSKHILDKIYKLNLSNKLIILPQRKLDEISLENHQGIILYYWASKIKKSSLSLKNGVKRPPFDIPLKIALENYPGIYILTDRIQDPQNLGSIIRSTEALGGMGIIITGKGTPFNDTVKRVATSSFLYLPIIEYANAYNVILEAKKFDYWILATTTKKSSKSISLWDLPRLPKSSRYIIMLGNEGDGLKEILLQNSDFWLEIPMLGNTESLNVSNALSILLYEMVKFVYKE